MINMKIGAYTTVTFDNGKPISVGFDCPAEWNDLESEAEIKELIQNQLKLAGFDVKVEVLAFVGSFLCGKIKNNEPCICGGRGWKYPTPFKKVGQDTNMRFAKCSCGASQ